MPQDCISMQSKQQANEAPRLLWIQWFEGYFTDQLGRSDFAKGVGYSKGRRGRHKFQVAVAARRGPFSDTMPLLLLLLSH